MHCPRPTDYDGIADEQLMARRSVEPSAVYIHDRFDLPFHPSVNTFRAAHRRVYNASVRNSNTRLLATFLHRETTHTHGGILHL